LHEASPPRKRGWSSGRRERPGRGEIELHIRFLALAYCDCRPLVLGAAEERSIVLLKEVVAVFPREEAGCFSPKAREAGNAEAEEGKREQPSGR
jgi:hypothetical protein